jgi:hypothetical protein
MFFCEMMQAMAGSSLLKQESKKNKVFDFTVHSGAGLGKLTRFGMHNDQLPPL